MATKLVMPRLGWTMEEGIFVEWNKQDGDRVEKGEILFSVEGDKAIQEVEAFDSGILRIAPNKAQPDDVIKVGVLLGYLVEEGETAPFGEEASAPEAPATAASGATAPATTKRPTLARSATTSAHSSGGRKGGPTISPRARRAATQLGVDWTVLEGSGRSGRIIEKDVQTAGPPLPQGERLPITRIRHLIAERMVASVRTTAPVTLTTEADATDLVAWRQQARAAAKEQGEVAPTYNDVLIKLSALALEQHPQLNAVWTASELVIPDDIHIGLATDTVSGLLVPVVRDAGGKSLVQIAADTRRLNKAVQSRSLSADELTGATFTIANLGIHGIDAFTPIINLPQCAILGVGRIILKPAVYQGQVVPRQLVSLSLSFDHRIADGGPAARFLNTIRLHIEQPQRWAGAV
jgi:pyruvate dehydrogenase E2 component (dihydrolipoamide acetyltransferase)